MCGAPRHELPSFGEERSLHPSPARYSRSRYRTSTTRPPPLPPNPVCLHPGQVNTKLLCPPYGLFPLLSGWNAVWWGGMWIKSYSWAPHTQAPTAVSHFILRVGRGRVEKSQPETHQRAEHIFLATKRWTPRLSFGSPQANTVRSVGFTRTCV